MREAWPDEAGIFTPWFAENLDALGDAIGLSLAFEDREVQVEEFFAAIIARSDDDTRVLIENQFEKADHRHLGRILTYMAGLEVRTVVWVAGDFRSAHLSAIKWLNEHTADGFSFLAVRVRAIRIDESRIAPVFDVLEKPNTFERRLRTAASRSVAGGTLAAFRRDFWQAYLERYPEDRNLAFGTYAPRESYAIPFVWFPVDAALNVSIFLAQESVGIFVRGPRGGDPEEVAERLAPLADTLAADLGASVGPSALGHFLVRQHKTDMKDRANWPAAIDWLHERAHTYLRILRNRLEQAGR